MVQAKKTSEKVKPIYVVSGKDSFLVNSQVEMLIDKLLEPDQRAMSLYQPDVKTVKLSDILDELRTPAFFSGKRVVLLKDADRFISEYRSQLESYFDDPSESGIFILVVQSWASNTRLAKILPKAGQLIAVSDIKDSQLPGYVTHYVKQTYNKNLPRNAAYLLVELCGDNPGKLCSEADKLILYAGKSANITTAHIESLVGNNRTFGAFAVIDSMTSGNISDAVVRLRNMFASDKSTEYTVVGAFAYHFRRMFQARAMLDKGMSQNQVAGALRIWYNKDAFFTHLRKLTLKQIGTILMDLARIDYSLKTGQMKAPVAMERLMYKLAS